LFRLYVALGRDTEAAKYKTLYQDDELGYPHLNRQDDDLSKAIEKIEYRDI